MTQPINCKGMAWENLPPILTVQQVSQVLGVSYKTTLKLIHSKRIKAKRIGRSLHVSNVELMNHFDIVLE